MVVLNYLGKTPILDDEGNETGEFAVQYGEGSVFWGHKSGARGSAYAEMFGTDISYDKTIVITKALFDKLGIDENSVFFLDKKPEFDANNMPLYDYKVGRIAETLNEVAIALKRVR